MASTLPDGPAPALELAVGADASRLGADRGLPAGQRLFGAGLPGAAALEAAIESVEEALMPALRGLPRGALLVVSAPGVELAAGIAARVPPDADALWRLAAVEQAFGALAAVAQGRPAGDWAIDGPFAATLLIVRELMHHAGCTALRVAD